MKGAPTEGAFLAFTADDRSIWPKFIAQRPLAVLHRVRGHAFRINPVALRTLKRADYESSPIWRDTRKHSPDVAALTCWPTNSFKIHGVPQKGQSTPLRRQGS